MSKEAPRNHETRKKILVLIRLTDGRNVSRKVLCLTFLQQSWARVVSIIKYAEDDLTFLQYKVFEELFFKIKVSSDKYVVIVAFPIL